MVADIREEIQRGEWYRLHVQEVIQRLESDAENGLAEAEASRRLEKYGKNELVRQEVRSPWAILWEQISGVMVLILFAAAAISVFLGDITDAVVILAIILINAAIGFQQEYKAEQSMAALKKLAVPTVKIRRGGQVEEMPSGDLIPGDIIVLETGNLVPADGRVTKSVNLRVDEAPLTGESVPIEKEADLFYESERALADRRNMVYSGTVVNYGRGEFVVTETGMQTELGKIASLIGEVEREPTPLQQRLDRVGKVLAIVAIAIVAVIFLMGLLRGEDLEEMFLTAVSLAVAAVPEALPAVATIALALGAQRMLTRQALIRKLPAVETLGSVNVICSDKTGTLTRNQMSVTVLDIANHRLELHEAEDRSGLEIVVIEGSLEAPAAQPTIDLMLIAGALCNDAMLQHLEAGEKHRKAVGDPTETALVMAAAENQIDKNDLDAAFPRIGEVPFNSRRKRMTTLHRTPQSHEDLPASLLPFWERRLADTPSPYMAVTKGAIDGLMDISSQVLVEGRTEPLDEHWKKRLMEAHDRMAQKGMRILGIGMRLLDQPPAKIDEDTLERDLILIGLVGMIDPPRPEVKTAVEKCESAGIRTVMITGDHPLTARHIADQLKITRDGRYLTGQELDRLSETELDQAAREIDVFARVSPEHKIRLVQSLREQGYVAAMTGDGVNDAPALKKADIGVAMGITGTDVAKEASDMVLLDDNFATIVAAVEEGRVIYDNIRKVIEYLLSCNSAEIAVMLIRSAVRDAPAAAASTNLVDEPGNRWFAGVGAGDGAGRERGDAAPTQPIIGEHIRPAPGAEDPRAGNPHGDHLACCWSALLAAWARNLANDDLHHPDAIANGGCIGCSHGARITVQDQVIFQQADGARYSGYVRAPARGHLPTGSSAPVWHNRTITRRSGTRHRSEHVHYPDCRGGKMADTPKRSKQTERIEFA